MPGPGKMLLVGLGEAGGVAVLVQHGPVGPEVERWEGFEEAWPGWAKQAALRVYTVLAPFHVQTLISGDGGDRPENGVSQRAGLVAGSIKATLSWRDGQVKALERRMREQGIYPDAVIPPGFGLLSHSIESETGFIAEGSAAGGVIAAWQPGKVYVRTLSGVGLPQLRQEVDRTQVALDAAGWTTIAPVMRSSGDGAPGSLLVIAEGLRWGRARRWNLIGRKGRALASLNRNAKGILGAAACFFLLGVGLMTWLQPAHAKLEERAEGLAAVRAHIKQSALEAAALHARKLELEEQLRELVDWHSRPALIVETLQQLQAGLDAGPDVAIERIEIGDSFLLTGRCEAGSASTAAKLAGRLSFNGAPVNYELKPTGDVIHFRLVAGGKEAE